MPVSFFVADLHGSESRYEKLFAAARRERPRGLFLGGDLFPNQFAALTGDAALQRDFTAGFLAPLFLELRRDLGRDAPEVFLILGNDDVKADEPAIVDAEKAGAWWYAHNRCLPFDSYRVYGYSYVPPTPFLLKDWERYDVSRYVDPGCVSPEEGRRTAPIDEREARNATIQGDLEALVNDADMSRAIFLFHTPPYDTSLDRAALDGRVVENAPVDLHVGSIAVRRFIEARRPRLTLHGHVHESARLTGSWRCRVGGTWALGAAHDGEELALVRFDPDRPDEATRELL